MSEAFDRTVDLVATHASETLSRVSGRGDRTADLFVEDSHTTLVSYRRHRGAPVFQRRSQHVNGAGLHVFDSDSSLHACTDDLSAGGLSTLAGTLSGTTPSGEAARIDRDALQHFGVLPHDTLERATDVEVNGLLERAADAALSLRPNLTSIDVDIKGRSRRFILASSDGRFVRSAGAEISLRVRLRATDGTQIYAVGGGRGGLGVFVEQRPEDLAREAAERLRAMAGRNGETQSLRGDHPVVIGGGWGGVWLHEVVGHALEADVGVLGSDQIDERVARDDVTVIDDPAAAGRGAADVDDEGTPSKRTSLIEEGVLRALLTDRASALRHDLGETGNGRRQDYRHPPLPRMSNLMLVPGAATPDDLFRAAGTGLFVKMIGSGRVDPSKDVFSFDVLEGYRIENGRLGAAVTGACLSGRPSQMLRHIVGVGNDFQLDAGRGSCEKKGQVVPVSVGMPTVLLDRMSLSSSA